MYNASSVVLYPKFLTNNSLCPSAVELVGSGVLACTFGLTWTTSSSLSSSSLLGSLGAFLTALAGDFLTSLIGDLRALAGDFLTGTSSSDSSESLYFCTTFLAGAFSTYNS